MAQSHKRRLLSRAYVVYSDEQPYEAHSQSHGTFRQDRLDAFYPMGTNGFPVTDLGRLADPGLTESEREGIFLRLGGRVNGSFLPSELSDDDVMSLIPPRFLNDDAVDVQRWRDYLGEHVLKGMKDPDKVDTDTNSKDKEQ